MVTAVVSFALGALMCAVSMPILKALIAKAASKVEK